MFEIRLYKYLGESNRVDKLNHMDGLPLSIFGTLKEGCSIIQPSLMIDNSSVSGLLGVQLTDGTLVEGVALRQSGSPIMDYNYCYIESFKRYYFITNIVSVSNKLWRIDMECDVLVSFWNDLITKSNPAFISRQEFIYDKYLVDDKLPAVVKPQIEFIEPTDYPSYITYPWEISSKFGRNYIVMVATTTEGIGEYATDNPNASPLAGAMTMYCLTAEQLSNLTYQLMNATGFDEIGLFFENIGDSILGIRCYPFEVHPLVESDDTLETTTELKMGKNLSIPVAGTIDDVYYSQLPAIRYTDVKYIELSLGKIFVPKYYDNFLDYSPFTRCQLYIPFMGYIEVDTTLVVGKWVCAYLTIDPLTGAGTVKVVVRDNIDQYPNDSSIGDTIFIGNNKVGIDIPITESNAAEITRSLFTGLLKIGANAIGVGTDFVSSGEPALRRESGETDLSYDRRLNQQLNYRTGKKISSAADFASNSTVTLVNSMQAKVSVGSAGGNWNDMRLPRSIVVRLTRTVPVYATFANTEDSEKYDRDYAHMLGKPTHTNVDNLAGINGYTELGSIHLDNVSNATSTEKDELVNILKSGIIIN